MTTEFVLLGSEDKKRIVLKVTEDKGDEYSYNFGSNEVKHLCALKLLPLIYVTMYPH